MDSLAVTTGSDIKKTLALPAELVEHIDRRRKTTRRTFKGELTRLVEQALEDAGDPVIYKKGQE